VLPKEGKVVTQSSRERKVFSISFLGQPGPPVGERRQLDLSLTPHAALILGEQANYVEDK
jgi:hypothetical protein